MLIEPYSAIASWEGYEYQRHTALYVALEKIRLLLNSGYNIYDSGYTLEIEGAEDFSIINGNSYESLHQVKAGSFSLNDNDKFCFLISILQYNVDKGFYHVVNGKNIPTDFVGKTYKLIKERQNDFKKGVEEIAKDTHLKKGSAALILTCLLEKCNYSYKIGGQDKAIEAGLFELKEYETKIANGKANDNDFINIYSPRFDNIDDVKKASINLLEDILDKIDTNWRLSDTDSLYSKFVYTQLVIMSQERITMSHIQKAKSCRILFKDIFRTIAKDYRSELDSIPYQYYKVWCSIQESFNSFPKKKCNDIICENCPQKSECNLNIQQCKILNIKENEIPNFLHKLMLKKPEEGKSNNLPDDNLITRLMTSMLKDINCLNVEENNTIQALHNNKFYRLTLNNSGETYELEEQLSNESVDKLLLYEADVLITDQLEADKFDSQGRKITHLTENEYKSVEDITSDSIEKRKKNCNKPKVLRLVNRKTAREELI